MRSKLIIIGVLLLFSLLAGCTADDPFEDMFTMNIYPGTTNTYDIGSLADQYQDGYFQNLYVNGVAVGGGGLEIDPVFSASPAFIITLADINDWSDHPALTTGIHGVGAGNVVGTTLVQELDGKTLDTSVGKGTWTASGVWKLPAMYFNGDITTDRWLSTDGNTFLGVDVVGADTLAHTAGSEGYYNTAVGYNALRNITTSYFNTAVGAYALSDLTTGIYNTAVGQLALGDVSTGNFNTAVGMQALRVNTGSYNTALGLFAGGDNVVGDSNVFLGSSAGKSELGSNKLYIDNVDTATPLIYGDFSTNALTINGTLSMATHQISDVVDPALAQDAATKNYVDTHAGGGGASPMGFNDDVALSLGTGNTSNLLWETADANANALLLALPVSNGTDIPGLVIGDANAINVDLALLNTFTFPSLTILDTDRNSYLTLSYSANDIPIIASNRSIVLRPSGDLDDYFTFATASNIPTIYGTGAYVRIGDAGTAAFLSNEDDLHVSGNLEVRGWLYPNAILVTGAGSANYIELYDNTELQFGNAPDARMLWETADANANELLFSLPTGTSVNVPAIIVGLNSVTNDVDLGLTDGITQPLILVIDKDGQLHSATNGIGDAGGATAILKHVGGFTNARVGDIVRITAGTLCTTGWYWITTVTSADQVTLDRNYTSGNTVNVTFVTFHSFPQIGADGVLLKSFDGAPSDANTEIDRDGWLELDVGQANGRLYWRANNAWHYVDATGGLSLTADERVDSNGHQFQIGDIVKLVVNRINEDGSFHAVPVFTTKEE